MQKVLATATPDKPVIDGRLEDGVLVVGWNWLAIMTPAGATALLSGPTPERHPDHTTSHTNRRTLPPSLLPGSHRGAARSRL